MAVTVRIDPMAHAALSEIARAKELSLTEALTRAVEAYRREVFLEGSARDFSALRKGADASADETAELAAWDATAADGLEDEPPHPDAVETRPRVMARPVKRRRSEGRRR